MDTIGKIHRVGKWLNFFMLGLLLAFMAITYPEMISEKGFVLYYTTLFDFIAFAGSTYFVAYYLLPRFFLKGRYVKFFTWYFVAIIAGSLLIFINDYILLTIYASPEERNKPIALLLFFGSTMGMMFMISAVGVGIRGFIYWVISMQHLNTIQQENLKTELFLVSSRQAASRRQRQLFAAVSVALAVSVLLSIFALVQRSSAIDQRNTALSRELGAQAERSYARDPELAVLLAVEGVEAKASAESEDTLRTALVRSRVRARHALGSPIDSADISPDNKLYAVSTSKRRGVVYDLATSKRLATFDTHTLGADLAWDPSSRRVAVGGNDGVARIFTARDGRLLAGLRTGHDAVAAVAWSPDGRRLAVGAADLTGSGAAVRASGGAGQIWDVASRRKVATLTGHPRGVTEVAWSADGRSVLTGGEDPGVRVWRAGRWTVRATLRHAADDVVTGIELPALNSDVVVTAAAIGGELDFERTGRGLLGRVGTRLWDLRSGELIRAFTNSIGPAAVHPGGTELAFGPPGQVIQVFDVAERELRPALFGHDGPINALRYTTSGTNLVSSGGDGTVRVWNPQLTRLVVTLAGHAGDVRVAELDGRLRRVVSGGVDGTARVWSLAPEEAVATHFGSEGFGAGLRSFVPALSPDGRVAVSRGGEAVADVWDPKTGRTIRSLSPGEGRVAGAQFTRDGHRLVTVHAGTGKTASGVAVSWDARTWEVVARVRPLAGLVSLSLSNSGRFATVGADGTASVWSSAGSLVAQVGSAGAAQGGSAGAGQGGSGAGQGGSAGAGQGGSAGAAQGGSASAALNDAVLSDDGELLVTAGADRKATLWSVRGVRRLRELRGHGRPVNIFESEPGPTVRERRVGVVTADFDGGGRRVATAGADGTARVWDVASGRLERIMRGHTEIVSSVQFSPDGSRLLTGSPDGTARVWRVDTGAQIRSVDHLDPQQRVLAETRAAWTSDGEYFVTDGAGSLGVSLWHADSGLRLVQASAERATVRPGGHELLTSFDTLSETYRCETCTGVDGLRRLAAKRVTRGLTKEERVRYLHESP